MTTLESAFQTLTLAPCSESIAPTLHLLDFPHELLSSVLEHLSSISDKKSLSICARICKRLHTPSQELLFALWEPKTSCETDTIESLKTLSTILDESPHLGRYIRSFWVFLGGLSDHVDSPSNTMYFGHAHRPSYSFGKPSTTFNAYQYTSRILPRLTHLKTLFIKPLGFEVATVNWTSKVDVPMDVRRALGRVLRGADLNSVIVESVDGFDLGVFGEVDRIRAIELYGTTLANQDNAESTISSNPVFRDQKCCLNSMTYYLGSGNASLTFVNYCLDSQRCALSFNSLTHLHLRDPADRSGPNVLSGLLEHCSTTLVHLELLYNTEIDSRWEPPNLAPMSCLKSLRLTLWLSPSFLRLPEITHQDRCQQVLRLLNTMKAESTSGLGYQLPDYQVSSLPPVPLTSLVLSFNVRHRYDVVDKLLSKHKWDRLDDGLVSLKKDGILSLNQVEIIYRAKVAKDMVWKREGEPATLPALKALGVNVSLSMESLC